MMSTFTDNRPKGSLRRASKGEQRPRPTKSDKPFSIRLSTEERALLERQAGNQPLGAHIREQLLGAAQQPRQAVKKAPKMDYVLLGRILAALGKSELASNLCLLAVAVESGSVPVTPETETAIQEACSDVKAIRCDLIEALGLRSGDTS